MPPLEGLRLVKAYDNLPGREGLATGWGLSIWIEIGGRVTLFDTGGDGPKLLANLDALGLDPSRIDRVVLSHLHADHGGGLAALLKTHSDIELIVPQALSGADQSAIEALGGRITVAGAEPVEIDDGLFSTGGQGDFPPEQSLVISASRGLVVLTGCAHPGLEPTLDVASKIGADHGVKLLAGGFHLLDNQVGLKDSVLKLLRDKGVELVAPGHCTGDAFMTILSRSFGENFIDFGCGREIIM